MNTLILIFLVLMWLGLFLLWLFRKSDSDLKVKDLRISKKKFVQLAFQWCSANLGTIKHPYQLKIYYYRNNTFGGRYPFNGKQIVIYLYDELELLDLSQIILHEFFHHTQFEKRSSERDYDKKLQEIGYWNNPYEVEARRLAK